MDRAQDFFTASNGNDSMTLLTAAGYNIENQDSNTTIQGSADDDSVINYGTNVYISLGAGEDKVTMSGAHGTTIDAGTDDDWLLSNSSSSVSINGGAGNDYIDGMGAKITLIGGSGNDYLRNKVGTGTLDGGAGNDTIIAMGTSYIDAGDDDDGVTVFAGGTNSTVLGGKGNDHIQNLANNVTFIHKLGDGNDTLDGFRANSTLKVGSAYTKSTVNGNVLVQTNDGTITLLDAATLDSINVVVEDSSVINLTDDADVYTNSVTGVTINALGGNDSITNTGASVSIDAGNGDDYINSTNNSYSGAYVTILGGAGNDTIVGLFGDSSVLGGAGADLISMTGDVDRATVDAGAGNDTIYMDTNDGRNWIHYNLDDGDDLVFRFNANDTLKIGNGTTDTFCSVVSGSDVNVSVGSNVITLSGAVSISSLHIAGTYYNPLDIVGTEEANSINNSLSGATIHALGGNDSITNTGTSVSIDAGDDDDYISSTNNSYSGAYVTILGGAGNDTIVGLFGDSSVFGGAGADLISMTGDVDRATVDAGAGNDTIYMDTNDGRNWIHYNLDDGDDLVFRFNANDTLKIGNGTTDTFCSVVSGSDVNVSVGSNVITLSGAASLSSLHIAGTYYNPLDIVGTEAANSINNSLSGATIHALGGNDSITNTGTSVSIDAGDDDDYISSTNNSYSGAYVTILGGAGNDTIVGLFGDSSVFGGAGADLISMTGDVDRATVDAGAGNDTIYMDTNDGRNWIHYNLNSGDDLVFRFNANDTLKIGNGTTDTFCSVVSGSDVNVSVGSNVITLSGAASLSSLYIAGTYSEIRPNSWTIEGNTARYGTSTNTLITITGVADDATTDDFTVNDTTITIGKGAVNTDGTPLELLTDGYTLKLGKGMGTPSTVAASYNSDTMTYTTAGKSNGYTLSDDGQAITCTAGTTKQIEFLGVADDATASNFFIKGKTITIGKGAVKTDGTPLELLTDGYTLKLGKGMGDPETVAASYNSDTMTYTTAGKSNGYTLSDDGQAITCTAGTTKQIEFLGVADDATTSNFYVKGKTITIGKGAVKTDGTPLELLTDGYTLKLGKGMGTPSTVAASYNSDTMTYTTAGKTEGYTLADNTITYTAPTSKTFEFLGVADGATASNFYIKGKTITIAKAAVKTDGTPLELLTDGYTLKLGKGMGDPETVAASYNSDTMTYITAGKSNGYTLSDDGQAITCTAGTTKQIEFLGVADDATTSNFFIKGKTITIAKAAVKTDGTALELLTDGYTLKLGKGMGAPTDDPGTLKNGIYTFGGKTAGYSLSADKKIINCTAESPKLKLSGVASEPAAPSGGGVTLTPENFSDNLSVLSNAGDYSFSIATGNYDGKTFTGNTAADFISNTGSNININSGGGNDYIKSSGSNVVTDGGAGADTILSGRSNDSLSGGAGNDSLSGGAGNDTLWGGTGNDTLTGGSGSDVFIYRPNEGKDTISDYASGELLQILNADGSAGTFSGSSFSGGKLTLTIQGGGSLIFNNVSANTSFNINGTTHTISDGRLV